MLQLNNFNQPYGGVACQFSCCRCAYGQMKENWFNWKIFYRSASGVCYYNPSHSFVFVYNSISHQICFALRLIYLFGLP